MRCTSMPCRKNKSHRLHTILSYAKRALHKCPFLRGQKRRYFQRIIMATQAKNFTYEICHGNFTLYTGDRVAYKHILYSLSSSLSSSSSLPSPPSSASASRRSSSKSNPDTGSSSDIPSPPSLSSSSPSSSLPLPLAPIAP